MFTRKQHFHFHKIRAYLEIDCCKLRIFRVEIYIAWVLQLVSEVEHLVKLTKMISGPIGNCESVIFKWSKQIVKYSLVKILPKKIVNGHCLELSRIFFWK